MGFDLTPPNGTRSAIFKAYERKRENNNYESVGINVGDIGGECDRAIWYSFRRVSKPEVIEGRKLRIFDTGNKEEERIVDDLIEAGIEVQNRQARIRLVGGHVRGKIDGEALGILEAPKTVHVLEAKSSNDKNFKLLQKNGLQKAKPEHYAQCQIGMHARGLDRAHYHVVNKNDDDIYVERVEYDAAYCLRTLARAERIIRADDPPSRISENPKVPPCLWCHHRPICHEGEWSRQHCRTCLHATAITTSTEACWDCARFSKPLTLAEQAVGCPSHLFIPSLVPGSQVDADPELETVTYRLANGETWVNGK